MFGIYFSSELLSLKEAIILSVGEFIGLALSEPSYVLNP